jgi:hypothetical protein
MVKLNVGLGIGAIVAVLLPIALLLFGVLTLVQTVSGILLLNGLWLFVFGAALGPKDARLYNAAWGAVIALLSTFAFLPLRYTAGLVVLAVIGATVATVVVRSRTKTS